MQRRAWLAALGVLVVVGSGTACGVTRPGSNAPPATTPSSAPPTSKPPTTAPGATTTTAPRNTGGPIAPGSVGYLERTDQLLVVNSSATAPPGTTWNPLGYLEVVAPTVLDHVWVQGGLYDSSGNLTVRDSIVQGGASWFVLVMSKGGTLTVEDSTLRWGQGGTNPDVGNGAGVVQISGTTTMTLRRVDLSGMPDGVQAAGTTLLDRVWIHDLAMVGAPPHNTHNDGVQFYAGDLTIRGSYLDTGATMPYSNAAVFLQGGGIGQVRIEDTHLNGGGYTLYAQNGRVSLARVTYGPDRLWGQELIQPPATRAG